MKTIVGLGNPGAKYKGTFHNVGFSTVDLFAKKAKLKFTKVDCKAKLAFGHIYGEDFVLAKPQTFMNLSGESVERLAEKYCGDVSRELLIIYDDADLPLGKMRLREEGSSGTHNGMRSIVAQLQTTSFLRLRIGIRNDELAEKRVELIDYVLSKPDYEDKLILDVCVAEAAGAIRDFITGVDFQRIEEKINRKNR